MDAATGMDLAARRRDEFVATLEQMVNVDCGSFTADGVTQIADMCEARFRSDGWQVARQVHVPKDGEARLGDLVIGTLTGAGGPRVLLVGHTDTVFDEGTVALRPFRIEDLRAYGPGVSDMRRVF
jgi:glutamate carboxypeptidase